MENRRKQTEVKGELEPEKKQISVGTALRIKISYNLSFFSSYFTIL